jgi:hypothetical protein
LREWRAAGTRRPSAAALADALFGAGPVSTGSTAAELDDDGFVAIYRRPAIERAAR